MEMLKNASKGRGCSMGNAAAIPSPSSSMGAGEYATKAFVGVLCTFLAAAVVKKLLGRSAKQEPKEVRIKFHNVEAVIKAEEELGVLKRQMEGQGNSSH